MNTLTKPGCPGMRNIFVKKQTIAELSYSGCYK